MRSPRIGRGGGKYWMRSTGCGRIGECGVAWPSLAGAGLPLLLVLARGPPVHEDGKLQKQYVRR